MLLDDSRELLFEPLIFLRVLFDQSLQLLLGRQIDRPDVRLFLFLAVYKGPETVQDKLGHFLTSATIVCESVGQHLGSFPLLWGELPA